MKDTNSEEENEEEEDIQGGEAPPNFEEANPQEEIDDLSLSSGKSININLL